jgi:hypothetical protein
LMLCSACVVMGDPSALPASRGLTADRALEHVTAIPIVTQQYLGDTLMEVAVAIPAIHQGNRASLSVWAWVPRMAYVDNPRPPRNLQPRSFEVTGAPTFIDFSELIPDTAEFYAVKIELRHPSGVVEKSFQVFKVRPSEEIERQQSSS